MNVLITRPVDQLGGCVNDFSSEGLYSFWLPMIETKAEKFPVFLASEYDYCLLTSPEAVRHFSYYLREIGIKQYVAVGDKTAEVLAELAGIPPESIAIPRESYAEGAAALLKEMGLKNKTVLSPGAEKRVVDLSDFFRQEGALYDAATLYYTSPVAYEAGVVDEFVFNNHIEAVTFFSPSAVIAYVAQTENLNGKLMAAIGMTTARALQEHGVEALCPAEPSSKAMARMLAQQKHS